MYVICGHFASLTTSIGGLDDLSYYVFWMHLLYLCNFNEFESYPITVQSPKAFYAICKGHLKFHVWTEDVVLVWLNYKHISI